MTPDTHDGGSSIDYSRFARPLPEPQAKPKRVKAEAEEAEVPPSPLETLPDNDYRDAQANLSEFYQDIQARLSDLENIEAKKQLLAEYEKLARAFLQREKFRIREEEEILAFLMCN